MAIICGSGKAWWGKALLGLARFGQVIICGFGCVRLCKVCSGQVQLSVVGRGVVRSGKAILCGKGNVRCCKIRSGVVRLDVAG